MTTNQNRQFVYRISASSSINNRDDLHQHNHDTKSATRVAAATAEVSIASSASSSSSILPLSGMMTNGNVDVTTRDLRHRHLVTNTDNMNDHSAIRIHAAPLSQGREHEAEESSMFVSTTL
jgi:hypothetical protein